MYVLYIELELYQFRPLKLTVAHKHQFCLKSNELKFKNIVILHIIQAMQAQSILGDVLYSQCI